MKRGEVWWADFPSPVGKRPVLLLSRNRAIEVRASVIVAQITRTVRAIPTEVPLGPEDGLPKACVVNADVLMTIPKANLLARVCALSNDKLRAAERAVRFALALR